MLNAGFVTILSSCCGRRVVANPPFWPNRFPQAMAASFGRPVEEVLAWVSPRPVAAASLGQVYRGKLTKAYGGGDVAVKVRAGRAFPPAFKWL